MRDLAARPATHHAEAAGTLAATQPCHLAHPAYRSDIDGLRALGVLLVVVFHAFPRTLPGGFIGVDVFFVVSGYLISTIVFGNLEHDSFSLAEFYARRIRRIFPALAIVLATGLVLGWFILFFDEQQQLGLHVLAGAGFVSNLMLWSEAGYFDSDATAKPFLHLWSLGIEEQFYIFWPLLLALAWKRRYGFLAITVVIAIASFAANVLTITTDPVAAFYSPWSRFWELMTGGLLAHLALHRPDRLSINANWQSAAGLLMIAVALALLNKNAAFPGWWALLPTIGTCLIIAAGTGAWLNRKFLSSRLMVGIGLISYPLYLWHWLLLSFAWIARGRMPPPGVRWALVIASFLLAYLTYRFVEKRVRAGGNAMVGALVAVMVSLAAVGLLTYSGRVSPRNDSKAIGPILEALHDWDYPDGFAKTNVAGVPVRSIKGGEKTVLFIGDSHLEQYGPRVVHLLESDSKNYGSALFLTDPGCAPVPGSAQTNRYHVEECRIFREQVAQLVLRPEISAVVIAAAWNLYYLEASPQAPEGLDLDFELSTLQAFIESIASHKKVYLLLDNPSGAPFEPRHFFSGTRLTSLTVKPFKEHVPLDSDQNALRLRLGEAAARGRGDSD
ncbi:MAG: acyltransferase [Candidatus Accumulibacter sp.]|nr:acyltransferase [Accumulibacter sp.]